MNTAMVELDDKEVSELIKLVYQFTGITLGENPRQMLQMRLRKRFRELKCGSLEDYQKYLSLNDVEVVNFINSVTTNETYFFRTERVWNYLEKTFLDDWYSKNPGKTLHIWSGASSSGEEAYSLGMMCENFKILHPDFNYKITGTDISEKVVKAASSGVYSGRSIELIEKSHPQNFQRYFNKINITDYQVSDRITKNVSFHHHNLFKKFIVKDKFDLVLLRNVLIYFNPHDQRIVIDQVCSNAKDNAILIVGESESLSHLNTECHYLSPLLYQIKHRGSSHE